MSVTPEPLHQRVIFKGLLLMVSGAGVFYFLINIQRGLIGLAWTELAMSVASLWLWRNVDALKALRLWSFLYLIPFFSIILFALSDSRISYGMFVWVLLIPIVSYLLLGLWRGFAMTCVFMTLAAAVYIWRFHNNPEVINTVVLANVMVCAAALWAFSHIYELSRERSQRILMKLASRDALTGLYNRLRLTEIFNRERQQAEAQRQPLSLLLIDLDYFKKINDHYGHDTGDQALVAVAAHIRQHLRRRDSAFRLGGEEFCILLPGSGREEAHALAESLRLSLAEQHQLVAALRTRLTLSAGVATLGADGDDFVHLYSMADQRLYLAKHSGRNRVISEGQAVPEHSVQEEKSPSSALQTTL
ncbi:GGDEF domain-containing protein [Thalassolituus hydrocarboniclasticus]|uniref:diguanylate cyclase n=1 Tax=Thalassolituus hydrocarboniclasticus TaxID=2742796 RepID=A0ABY6AAV6_9GAMM|nr:GGDEF domain-containing protein [Thalassolituus hydrocarboniclasticus]UXD88161.1 GGDEF domain-containing protein [Thalassolituus hydrocarboniclasticus]